MSHGTFVRRANFCTTCVCQRTIREHNRFQSKTPLEEEEAIADVFAGPSASSLFAKRRFQHRTGSSNGKGQEKDTLARFAQSTHGKELTPSMTNAYSKEWEKAYTHLAAEENPSLDTLAKLIDEDRYLIRGLAANWTRRMPADFHGKARVAARRNTDFWNLAFRVKREGNVAVHRQVWRNFLEYVRTHVKPNSMPERRMSQLMQLTDYSYPTEWNYRARQRARKIIMHVGPTNSGKTHTALVALAKARTGVYAGPLRLLAHEVFARFNAGTIGGLNGKGRVCNLLTGEEKRILDPHGTLSSCTVEMIPTTTRFEVAVIDEIQMIGDHARGSAWTQALLSVQADEIHLCGEERAVEIVKRIAKETGDEVEIRQYKRLNPLQVGNSLQGDLSKVRRGDCVVTFSRNNIFALKRDIEAATGLRVAIAYGGLPPEVREEQARLFNEGKQYDVMVASDAIGMGLNLFVLFHLLSHVVCCSICVGYNRRINRVIFETLQKWDGTEFTVLPTSSIKQIAGRAGRFGMSTPAPSLPDMADTDSETLAPSAQAHVPGEATTLEESDLILLREAMNAPTEQMQYAVLKPGQDQLELLATIFPPDTPFSTLLQTAHYIAQTNSNYHVPHDVPELKIAALISSIQGLTLAERVMFSSAPANLRDEASRKALLTFADAHATTGELDLAAWAERLGTMELVDRINAQQLSKVELSDSDTILKLESFHKSLTIYLWLSYRLPLTFSEPELARRMRKEVEKAIEAALATGDFRRRTVKHFDRFVGSFAPGSQKGLPLFVEGGEPVKVARQ